MEIVIAVVSAAAGALVREAVHFALNHVGPRVARRFGKRETPLLASQWKTTFREGGIEYSETVSLTHVKDRVDGRITLTEAGAEPTVYSFSGTFRNLALTATYESTDTAHYERGVFALRYTRRQSVSRAHLPHVLKGQYVLFAQGSDDFISSDYQWTEA